MKRLNYLWFLTGYAALVLGFLSPAHASDYGAKAKAGEETKYQHPEDLLDLVPFLSEIPRTFLLGDGYKMKLSGRELRIDHMGFRSSAPVSHRDCLIGISYTTPVAFFTSRIDIPLFNSQTLAWSDWSRSSIGDYVVYLSKTPVDNASLRLVATARF